MLLDTQLIFDSNSSLIASAVSVPSENVIDLAGVGVGQAPPNYFGVQDLVFGEDIGIGDGASPPVLTVIVGTTFTTANAGTLTVALQYSIDSGAPGYTPSAWVTALQTGAIAVANLTAGQQIAEMTMPPRAPGQGMPRFIRLLYIVANAFTAGTIAFAGINTGRNDDTKAIYPAAY
jgi:hypothetical protein